MVVIWLLLVFLWVVVWLFGSYGFMLLLADSLLCNWGVVVLVSFGLVGWRGTVFLFCLFL